MAMMDVKKLTALLEKATPGPWFVCGVRTKIKKHVFHAINRYDETKKQDENILLAGYDVKTHLGFHDAQLAALAPELAKEVIRLTALLENNAKQLFTSFLKCIIIII